MEIRYFITPLGKRRYRELKEAQRSGETFAAHVQMELYFVSKLLHSQRWRRGVGVTLHDMERRKWFKDKGLSFTEILGLIFTMEMRGFVRSAECQEKSEKKSGKRT